MEGRLPSSSMLLESILRSVGLPVWSQLSQPRRPQGWQVAVREGAQDWHLCPDTTHAKAILNHTKPETLEQQQ
jgi:hypothetical protein